MMLLDPRTHERYHRILGLAADDAGALPPWLGDPLVATTAARVKLCQWTDRTPREQWTAPRDPAAALSSISFVGDQAVHHLTARIVTERLPPPVCDYALTRCTIIGAGAQIRR